MLFTRIAHVCLHVTDLSRSLAYYKKLGFTEVFHFTRKGREKDLRTQQIERDQMAKWEKDLSDEERIIRAEAKKKVVTLLTGKELDEVLTESFRELVADADEALASDARMRFAMLTSELALSLSSALFTELQHPSGHRYPAPGAAASGRRRLAGPHRPRPAPANRPSRTPAAGRTPPPAQCACHCARR